VKSFSHAWAAIAGVLALALLGVFLWTTRYEYVGAGDNVIRLNRWTGTAAVLRRSGWQPVVRRQPVDPVDSLARAHGVDLSSVTTDAYADIVKDKSVK
jgi:hypothetical protein